jgi:hypothetical protein
MLHGNSQLTVFPVTVVKGFITLPREVLRQMAILEFKQLSTFFKVLCSIQNWLKMLGSSSSKFQLFLKGLTFTLCFIIFAILQMDIYEKYESETTTIGIK